MKISKLMQLLMFGMSMFRMGIVEEGGGDGGAAAAAEVAAAEVAAAGGKKPSDEEAKLLKEVMQKKEALSKSQFDLAAANDRLKEFEGVDPAVIRKMLADKTAAEDAQLEAKGDFERIKLRMADEHTKTTTSLQDQIAALTTELGKKSSAVDELSVGSQFTQSAFIAEDMVLTPTKARTIYGAHFDLENGKVVPYDKPRGESNRTALVDARGEPVSFDDAMRKIVEADPEKDHMLKSKVRPGSGSETKKTDPKVKTEAATDAVSKISAGLKSLNLLAQAAQ